MKSFSNQSFVQLITPKTSGSSSQSIMLLGISLAGVSLTAIALCMHYHRQIDLLKKQNEMLSAKLKALERPVAVPDGIDSNEELDQDPDN